MCLGWAYCTIGMGGEGRGRRGGKEREGGEREGKLGEEGKVIRDILHHKYYFC